MANKLKIAKTNSVTSAVVSQKTGPETITSNGVTGTPGSVGGVYTQSGIQIHPQVNTGNGATDGSILRQKGAHKFYCDDGTTKKICTLVNNKTLTAGQMNIPVYTGTFSGNIADTSGAATSSYLRYQTSSLVGVAPTVGQVIHDVAQSITGTVTVTAVNATVGGYGNVTVAFSNQDGDPPSGNYTMEAGFYASRISNRWVSDFSGNKYRYWSQSPTTANKYSVDAAAGTVGFVQVPDAS